VAFIRLELTKNIILETNRSFSNITLSIIYEQKNYFTLTTSASFDKIDTFRNKKRSEKLKSALSINYKRRLGRLIDLMTFCKYGK
jgi:hypothetical protein